MLKAVIMQSCSGFSFAFEFTQVLFASLHSVQVPRPMNTNHGTLTKQSHHLKVVLH